MLLREWILVRRMVLLRGAHNQKLEFIVAFQQICLGRAVEQIEEVATTSKMK